MTQIKTARFGVVGNPINHSQSPFIHKAFAKQTGINLSYKKILAPLDGFNKTISKFFKEGGLGLNITVPFKQEAFEMAHSNLSDQAKIAGAVNTLWINNKQLHGCNTDGAGLVADLTRLGYTPKGKRILLIGAGGAARGAAPSLLNAGCSYLYIVNRTPDKAKLLCSHLVNMLPKHALKLDAGSLDSAGNTNNTNKPTQWDIVINATSSSLVTGSSINITPKYADHALAYDMVYGNKPTSFMLQSQQQGASVLSDGLGMLVGQAAISYYIWLGIEPSIMPVLTKLRQQLNG